MSSRKFPKQSSTQSIKNQKSNVVREFSPINGFSSQTMNQQKKQAMLHAATSLENLRKSAVNGTKLWSPVTIKKAVHKALN